MDKSAVAHQLNCINAKSILIKFISIAKLDFVLTDQYELKSVGAYYDRDIGNLHQAQKRGVASRAA